jgi:CPA1 family monovalent cation:H+ antiporter
LHLAEDDTVEHEVRLARVATLRAALAATDACADNQSVKVIRDWYELQLRRAEQDDELGSDVMELVCASVQTERRRLGQLRAEGIIGDAAFQRVEKQLDWAELTLDQLKQL